MVIILMSVVLDVAQQRKAESTVDTLRRSVGIRTQVVREEWIIAVEQLVPGDVVLLAAGDVARVLTAQRPSDAFEHGIRRFGFLMPRFTVFPVLFVLAANVLFQLPWLALLFALALAIGLTPGLLPMVVTVTLANGARRLARRG